MQRQLGVECPRCQHRELISLAELQARKTKAGDRKEARVPCTKCRRTSAQVRTFLDNRSARRFMAEYR